MNRRCSLAIALAFACGAFSTSSSASNPVDHAGVQHNMYLSCFSDTGATGTNILVYLVEKCGYDPGVPTDEFVKKYSYLLTPNLKPISEAMAPFRDQYTIYEFSFFERIDQIEAVAKDLAEMESMLLALEAEAIANVDHKSDNGRLILGSLSVGRRSSGYWLNKELQVHSPCSAPAARAALRHPTKKEWKAIAAADITTFALSYHIEWAAAASQATYEYYVGD